MFAKFVSFNVCGITQISNLFFFILAMVKDTPFIKIDAFSTKYITAPNAGELIATEAYALKHQILRHYANYQS